MFSSLIRVPIDLMKVIKKKRVVAIEFDNYVCISTFKYKWS